MAVTKRLRYEVLRRDNHTCRYCGASAPDVKLTVDHVIPQALGGSDEPSNLVTACDHCNSGKTSIPADAPIVANVADDALRWAAAMDRAADLAHERHQVRLGYRDTFRQAWDDWKTGSESDQKAVPLDANWESSLDNFYEAGLPDWELTEAVRAAMTNQKVIPANTFRYFAGICWTKIRQMQDQARQIIDSEQPLAERKANDQEADQITERWLSAYQKHHLERGAEEDSETDALRASRVRERVVLLLEQGYSAATVSEAAAEAGRLSTFALSDYLGGWGDFFFDAAASWAIAWSSVEPEHKWWRTRVPTPASWAEFRIEIHGAVSAGLTDHEILDACKLAGEQQSSLLFGLPDWEGRWDVLGQ